MGSSSIPLFVDSGDPADMLQQQRTELQHVRESHETLLWELLKPLDTLDAASRDAINAESLAAMMAEAWQQNVVVLRRLLPRIPRITIGLPSGGPSTEERLTQSTESPPSPSPRNNYGDASVLLMHLERDWSLDGLAARRRPHTAVLRVARRAKRSLRILVPGAGLCRLAWELTSLGHRVEANDASISMLTAAQSLMDTGSAFARSSDLRFHVFPRAECSAGASSRSQCFRATTVPDVSAQRLATVTATGRLTLQVADFIGYYGYSNHSGLPNAPRNSSFAPRRTQQDWDMLATCYFMDTTIDPVETVRTIHSLLKPGGVWVNVGPLQWHEPAAGVLRLTLEELVAVVKLCGFHIRRLRTIKRVPYLAAMSHTWHFGQRRLLDSSVWHDIISFEAYKA